MNEDQGDTDRKEEYYKGQTEERRSRTTEESDGDNPEEQDEEEMDDDDEQSWGKSSETGQRDPSVDEDYRPTREFHACPNIGRDCMLELKPCKFHGFLPRIHFLHDKRVQTNKYENGVECLPNRIWSL